MISGLFVKAFREAGKLRRAEQPYTCEIGSGDGSWGEVRFCLNRRGKIGPCVRE